MEMSKGRLLGKTALVTGGGSGIGQAICKVFAREGANVAVVDINSEGIAETLALLPSNGVNVHCSIEADITCSDQVRQTFKTVEEKLHKKVTILVNAAGKLGRQSFLDELQEDEFDRVVKVNLEGTFIATKEFLTYIKKDQVFDGESRGVVVNISSTAGKVGKFKMASYSCSKFAVIGLTKTVALEYTEHKVRCNTVLPSAIDTPMFRNISQDRREMLKSQIPMQRFGKPEEVANACLFLASDESSYVNGACLEVSGGHDC